jgi:hypothetical protein
MGIDRIGKNGPPLPVHESGAASQAAPTGQVFQVLQATAAPSAPHVASEAPRGPLDRLRAGEVDVGGYVDLKVDEATSHLSALPPLELDAIRAALREHLANDPALAELVRTAAGDISPPQDD